MEDDRKMSLYKAPDYIQNGAPPSEKLQMKKKKFWMPIYEKLQMEKNYGCPPMKTPDEVAAKMKSS